MAQPAALFQEERTYVYGVLPYWKVLTLGPPLSWTSWIEPFFEAVAWKKCDPYE